MSATPAIESASPDSAPPRSQTAAYFAAFVALGLVTAALGPARPELASRTGMGTRETSFLVAAQSLGCLLGSIIGGRLFDRMKGHPLMAAALIVMAAMAAAVPMVFSLWLLVAVMLVLGIASGVADVGGNTLLVWAYREKVGPFMNGLHFSFGVGAFLSPIIFAQLALAARGRFLYWALILIIAPVAIFFLRLPGPRARASAKTDVPATANYTLIVMLALLFLLYVGAEMGYGIWIYSYALSLGLGGEATSAYLTSSFWGSFTLGRLLGVPVAARLRPRLILFGDLTGCLSSIAIILLWPGSITALWAGTILMGLSMASIFPTAFTLAERRMTITGKVTACFLVGGSTGYMFVPWLIGQAFDARGPKIMMLVIFSALLLCLGLVAAVTLFTKRSSNYSLGD
jgi:MFS transporter, FHS family, Na+ dependent glucose transporter 1